MEAQTTGLTIAHTVHLITLNDNDKACCLKIVCRIRLKHQCRVMLSCLTEANEVISIALGPLLLYGSALVTKRLMTKTSNLNKTCDKKK